MSGEDPGKIIIDEDWKSQVAKEKAAADAQSGAAPDQGAMPPVTFTGLVSMLATQALLALGQAVYPGRDKPEIHPEEARHFIDLLGLLEEKCKGNLTPEEATLLSNVLHELRLGYVYTTQQGSEEPPPAASGSPIIMP